MGFFVFGDQRIKVVRNIEHWTTGVTSDTEMHGDFLFEI